MLLVGLTGGIGSGKSTLARMLAARGAAVIDADDLARLAVDPGTPGLERVVEAFGPGILDDRGALDRGRLGEVVFTDAARRKALEAIVHPEVARLFAEALEPYRQTDRVVVYVVPLLVERSLAAAFDVVVAVEADEDLRVARVSADRGLAPQAVRDRIGAQASDADRAAVADILIANGGGMRELETQAGRLWADLAARAAGRA